MTVRIAEEATRTLVDEFVASGRPLATINTGLCADFADELAARLASAGLEATITGLDYFWAEDGGVDAEALMRRSNARLPPSLSWDDLTALDFANAGSHTWVEIDGRCFDAEVPKGVDNAFDLPSIRRSLTEIIGASRLATLVEEHPWWREAQAIFLAWEEDLTAAEILHQPR